MRTAILADIHSNLEALEAVLERAGELRAERFWVLGDLVGYGADPEAVLRRIRALDAVVIAGNHDLATLGSFDLGWFNPVAAEAIRWTRERLGHEAVGALERLEPSARIDRALLVHGSVCDPVGEYLVDVVGAAASFAELNGDLCLFGHSHLPTAFTLTGERLRARRIGGGEQVRLNPGTRLMLNPGSVGQPRDGDPRASFAMLDGDAITIHRVTYDLERAQGKIRSAGLPEPLAARLAVGR